MIGYPITCVQKSFPTPLENFDWSIRIRSMLEACWEYEPEFRPSMTWCHDVILAGQIEGPLTSEPGQAVAPPRADFPSQLMSFVGAAVPTAIVNGLYAPTFLTTLFGPSLKHRFLEGHRPCRALLGSCSFLLTVHCPKRTLQIGISYPDNGPMTLKGSSHADVRSMKRLLLRE